MAGYTDETPKTNVGEAALTDEFVGRIAAYPEQPGGLLDGEKWDLVEIVTWYCHSVDTVPSCESDRYQRLTRLCLGDMPFGLRLPDL